MTGFWNAIPASFTGAPTLLPLTVTVPRLGNCRPVASFMSVDFPQPEGPTTAAKAPSSTLTLKPSTAGAPSSDPE